MPTMTRMNPSCRLLLFATVSLFGLYALLPGRMSSLVINTDGPDELVLFCAAGMRAPLEKIAEDYNVECGGKVAIQYGGSNTLLSQIEVGKTGDLYLAADDWYLAQATNKTLVRETIPLAEMEAVVAVPKGNPLGIASLDDLLSVRLAIASPDQAAIGNVTRELLEAAARWDEIEEHAHEAGVFRPTAGEVANDVRLGSVDAGFVWDAVARQYPNLEILELPELDSGASQIGIGILTCTRNAAAALKFARYVAASDRGLPLFDELGYAIVDGDRWQPTPELLLYAGAVSRPALEPIVGKFEDREGVCVTTVYDGCRIFDAQLNGFGTSHSSIPDAYMPCDIYFWDEANRFFGDPRNVSSTPIVIAVAKGNPKGIRELSDLANKGVRIALGQPDQCAIGILSRRLLESERVYDRVVAHNLIAETTSSSLLVPSVTTGEVDAALVYATDALAESGKLTTLPIDSPLAQTVQPFGVANSTDQQQLVLRLRNRILASREQFEALGFGWESPP